MKDLWAGQLVSKVYCNITDQMVNCAIIILPVDAPCVNALELGIIGWVVSNVESNRIIWKHLIIVLLAALHIHGHSFINSDGKL